MPRIVFDPAAMTLTVLLLSVSICAAEDLKNSPHSDAGDCTICHVASSDKLRSWFTFPSTKREVKHDMNQICLKCHSIDPNHAGGFFGTGIGHAVGKKPALNNQNLPLDSDGNITCATTCHNMHATSDDRQLLPKRLRLPINMLCKSCHDK